MSKRRRQLKRERHNLKKCRCQYFDREAHRRCHLEGRRCVLTDAVTGEDQVEYFCREHARRMGYCASCGDFWAGIDSFELSGLCDHCWTEAQAEDGEDEFSDNFDAGLEREEYWNRIL